MSAEDGGAIPLDELPGRRALAGERPPPLTVRYRHQTSAEDRWSRIQSTPVFDEEGRVRLAINVIEDITDIKRAEQGHRFLARASQELASSLDYQETLRAVARLAVPEVADWCAVDVLAGDELERVAVEHVDPGAGGARARGAGALSARPALGHRAPAACCGADARSSTARSRTSCSCRRRSTRSTWS